AGDDCRRGEGDLDGIGEEEVGNAERPGRGGADTRAGGGRNLPGVVDGKAEEVERIGRVDGQRGEEGEPGEAKRYTSSPAKRSSAAGRW
ncbi:MAG TPA: hypothetical protein PKM39_02120, partial [Pseudothauera hydrothermalis]|nr:hypothetical protein [Pseudothauera hydrothermalis]